MAEAIYLELYRTKRMGFSDTYLRCYVLHDDEASQHIHIIDKLIIFFNLAINNI
ncbi:hypothetical protein [Photorhabdus australis]|uniref:hypothetical protein n=1 Tax=Photorhabdus australis TaxID=286156 RepID=UPI000A71BDCA|nr:hypothetical protein [Photorhabdus australis]